MPIYSKLAFGSKVDAENFIKVHGGKLTDFNGVIEKAKLSLKKDNVMVGRKKQKQLYPMGKRLFHKRCNKDLDLKSFKAINELKASIKNSQICKNINEKQLQAVALYLWDIKRVQGDNELRIMVTKRDKCPVCGMFVYKYPRWAAQIFYKHNNHEHHFSFDGVKDLMKYYFKHKQNISKILVTDYYTQKAIDGTKAYYVIGSDIYGPMGNELIPFKNKNDAISFKKDHRGNKIIKFNDIKESEVYDLDLK